MGVEIAKEQLLSFKGVLLGIDAFGKKTVAVGERGSIFLSDGDVHSWKRIASPVDVTLTGVRLEGDDRGWVVGHEQVILTTSDGGKNWQLVHRAEGNDIDGLDTPLFDIYFSSSGAVGLAVGAKGLVLRTKNNGQSWERSFVEVGDGFRPHLFSINELSDGQLLVTSEQGHLFRTADFGLSWQREEISYSGSQFGSVESNDGMIYSFGLSGYVFRRKLIGGEWEKVGQVSEFGILTGTKLRGSVFIAGLGGQAALLTADGQLLKAAFKDRGGVFDSTLIEGTGLIITAEGGIYSVLIP